MLKSVPPMPTTTKSKIIILNGASSTGKSSMAKFMQDQFKETYLHIGIDVFWMTMPPKQIDLTRVDPDFYTWTEEEIDGRPFLKIVPGPQLDRIMLARYEAIAAYLEAGFNIIADDVTWSKLWLDKCLECVRPFDAYFVGVYCDDRVLSHREILRGDRLSGWGRGSQKWVHEHLIYDMTIDTSVHNSEDLALKIVTAIEGGQKPEAVDKMRALQGCTKQETS
jgi:chloramphenicol 3-O phosphotransferase